MMIARQQQEDRQAAIKATMDYRAANQLKTMTESFALNDPDVLKNTATFAEAEGSFGASSLQVFDGEDLGFSDRKLAQQSQMRQWTVDAGTAMASTRRQSIEKQTQEEDTLAKQYQQTMALEQQSGEYLRGTREIFAQTNLEMAAEQRRLRKERMAAEAHANLTDMVTQVSTGLLNEDPSLAFDNNGWVFLLQGLLRAVRAVMCGPFFGVLCAR